MQNNDLISIRNRNTWLFMDTVGQLFSLCSVLHGVLLFFKLHFYLSCA